MRVSATRYARSGDVNIAYQVLGDSPRDLVLVPGWVSNIEIFWEEPSVASFLERLAGFSRLILFDKRGTGLSDRVTDMPTLETRMDDVRAVMDAVGSEKAALFGFSEGGSMCALFAATYPARTLALITCGAYARRVWSADHPWAPKLEEFERFVERVGRDWGAPSRIDTIVPTRAEDDTFRQWWARLLRLSASPAGATGILRLAGQIDVRHVLPSIRVPTLILHAVRDQTVDVRSSRYMAQHVPGAHLVELSALDHAPFGDGADAILAETERFLSDLSGEVEPDRVLATVMFVDIVGSTEKTAELGDRRWREALERFHATVRKEISRFRGREIDTAGDGVLATFDGPARAVRCACGVTDAVASLGLRIRAGLHTGECEVLGDKLAGIAVHIGSRVAGLAEAGEVLVSSTVRDLVAGSGLRFAERGSHTLKGVPGTWQIFAVEREAA